MRLPLSTPGVNEADVTGDVMERSHELRPKASVVWSGGRFALRALNFLLLLLLLPLVRAGAPVMDVAAVVMVMEVDDDVEEEGISTNPSTMTCSSGPEEEEEEREGDDREDEVDDEEEEDDDDDDEVGRWERSRERTLIFFSRSRSWPRRQPTAACFRLVSCRAASSLTVPFCQPIESILHF